MIRTSLLTLAMSVAVSVPALAQEVTSDILNNKGESIGTINATKAADGVLLNVDLKSLPPGPHGFHVHAVGDCSDHDHFKKAAGHVKDEEGDEHGLLNPKGPEAGDLPNLIVHQDGTVKAEIYAPDLEIGGNDPENLLDKDGSSFMIHANADDHKTQPIGGAGDRIACGVIKAK
jgi:Cu-Zn family superoxide dismutase